MISPNYKKNKTTEDEGNVMEQHELANRLEEERTVDTNMMQIETVD